MSEKTFENLTALLDQYQARYRVVRHVSAGKSEEVAKIRVRKSGKGQKPWCVKSKEMV
ncbi:YbaK/prolyl-tRNA synthetase associated domain-containing protein [Actinobacillus lignieresii]|nr:YbaK/prolyl-tRNA synthetase associated domain-containing protein [Actinobacillus lignieresii]